MDNIKDRVSKFNPNALTADGFDEAIMGMSLKIGREPLVAYDYEKCISILIDRDDMTREEAEEYMDFNVLGAYVGEGTPVFILTI